MINSDENDDQITISHVNNYKKNCVLDITKFLSQTLISITDLRVKYMFDNYDVTIKIELDL